MQNFVELISIIIESDEAFEPACDLFEYGGKLIVELEVPGLDKEHLKIDLYPDRLVVAGLKRRIELDGVHYTRAERMFGHFKRSIELPFEVEKVEEVSYSKGVLRVILKKKG